MAEEEKIPNEMTPMEKSLLCFFQNKAKIGNVPMDLREDWEELAVRLQSNLLLIRRSLGWSAADLGERVGVTRQTINNLESKSSGNYKMTKPLYLAIRSVLKEEIEKDPQRTTGLQAILEMMVDNPGDYKEESKEAVRAGSEAMAAVMEKPSVPEKDMTEELLNDVAEVQAEKDPLLAECAENADRLLKQIGMEPCAAKWCDPSFMARREKIIEDLTELRNKSKKMAKITGDIMFFLHAPMNMKRQDRATFNFVYMNFLKFWTKAAEEKNGTAESPLKPLEGLQDSKNNDDISLIAKLERMKAEAEKDQDCMIEAVRLLHGVDGKGKDARRLLLGRLLDKEVTPYSNVESILKTVATVNTEKTEKKDTTKANISELTDDEKELLLIIGRTGMSLSTEIRKASGIGLADASRALRQLQEEGYVNSKSIYSIPNIKGCSLNRLTMQGYDAYKSITGEEPKEPEMEVLRARYGSYEQGYGVRAVAMLLDTTGRYTSTNIFSAPVLLADGVKYYPEVKCVYQDKEGNWQIDYYLFFTGKNRMLEYLVKISKLSMITDRIHIIVQDEDKLDRIRKDITQWCETKTYLASYAGKVIRLTSYRKLSESIKNGWKYEDWWVSQETIGETSAKED